jgi:GNAT superfamily N-acetyltransferase
MAAGEFSDEQHALDRFAGEFGPHLEEMRERCLFLETATGEAVGTTTAWRDSDFRGMDHGRIHWVGVVPEHQGKGLGRLLVVKALLVMRKWHVRAYLSTQTSSWVAIHLYLTLGFIPYVTAPEQEAGWALLRDKAPHPLLGPPPYDGSLQG